MPQQTNTYKMFGRRNLELEAEILFLLLKNKKISYSEKQNIYLTAKVSRLMVKSS